MFARSRGRRGVFPPGSVSPARRSGSADDDLRSHDVTNSLVIVVARSRLLRRAPFVPIQPERSQAAAASISRDVSKQYYLYPLLRARRSRTNSRRGYITAPYKPLATTLPSAENRSEHTLDPSLALARTVIATDPRCSATSRTYPERRARRPYSASVPSIPRERRRNRRRAATRRTGGGGRLVLFLSWTCFSVRARCGLLP